MRLTQLRDFVSIVEAGSIRGAARAHGVSHPAMSKSLRALESEVGVPLIRRSTRGVVCSPAGRVLFARAGAIRAELRKAEGMLGRLDDAQRRAVESMTSQIVNKLLHLPTVRMKQAPCRPTA